MKDFNIGDYMIPIIWLIFILGLVFSVSLVPKLDTDCVSRNFDEIFEYQVKCSKIGMWDCTNKSYENFNCYKK